ncbi:hypothetical protein [Variovorax sp. GB1P17]|uniref:hypothetical protein n=1 Tax=Variovorax sp. GB1P17 TaxID=3443740 RepID=UPI003F47856B
MYTLRHNTITDLVQAGLDTLTVAQIAGTSVWMIELYYGHLTREHAKTGWLRWRSEECPSCATPLTPRENTSDSHRMAHYQCQMAEEVPP